jgi:hemerythrin superfamily protein
MNIYEALEKDHRQIESLLDMLLLSSELGSDQWKSLLDELRGIVIPHAHAEEAVFYNTLRELDQSKGLVAHSYGEHGMAEGEIRTLGAAKMMDANWTALIKKLRQDLLHHIEQEEDEVFESAREVLNEEEAEQIGAAFEALKIEMSRDADSPLASSIDFIANMMPPRFMSKFRQHFAKDQAA